MVARLRVAEAQHAAQLVDGHLVVDDLADLGEREPEVAEGEDPVQSLELVSAVPAVPGLRVDLRRRQEAHVVVVVQGAHRHLGHTGERPDPEHDSIPTTSRDVRVKSGRRSPATSSSLGPEPQARGDAGRAHALLMQARSIAERIGQSAVLADVVGLAEQRAEA